MPSDPKTKAALSPDNSKPGASAPGPLPSASDQAEAQNIPAAAPSQDNGHSPQPWHHALSRQITKHFGDLEAVPQEWLAFLKDVNDAYQQAEVDREALESERQERQLAEAMRKVGASLTATLDFNAVLDRLLEEMERVIPYDSANVMRVDAEQGRVRIARTRGYEKFGARAAESVRDLEFEIAATPILKRLIETRQPVVIPDPWADPEWIRREPGGHVRSWAGAPIVVQGEVIALFAADKVEPNFYRPEHIKWLSLFAEQAALALQNARLFEAARQQAVELEVVRQANLTLTSHLELPDVLDAILRSTLEILPTAQDAHIFLYDGAQLAFGAALWADGRTDLPYSQPRSDGLTYTVARSGQPMVVSDMRRHPLTAQWEGAIISLPLKIGTRVVGVMNVAFDQPHLFPESELRILRSLGDQAAIAIENARLFATIEKRAAELEAVRQMSLNLASSLEPQAVLDTILQNVLKLAPEVHDAHIYLYQAQTGQLSFGAASWADGRRGNLYDEPRPNGLTYTVARSGEMLVIPELPTHPLFAGTRRARHGAIVGLPLKFGLSVVGVLNVAYSKPRHFDEAELHVLTLVADQAASAVAGTRLFEATRRQLQELTALHAAAVAGAEATSEEALIERATELIGATLYPINFGLLLLDEATGNLRVHPSYHNPSNPPQPQIIPAGQGIAWQAITTGQPQRVGNVTQASAYWAGSSPTRSGLCAPLRVGGRMIGVINAESDRAEAFTEADERLLVTFAGQLATAIEKMRLFEAEREQRERAETLQEVAATLNSVLDREQLLQIILEQLARVVNYDSAAVMLISGETLTVVAHRGFHTSRQIRAPYRLEKLEHIRQVLETRRPVIIPDTTADARWHALAGAEYIRCWLGVPLVVKEHVIGLINLDRETPEFYAERHAELAAAFANQAAVAIERLRLLEETQRREREMVTLLNVARVVSSTLDLKALTSQVAVAIAQALQMERCEISTYDPERRTITVRAIYDARGADYAAQIGVIWPLNDFPSVQRIMEDDEVLMMRTADSDADPAEMSRLNPLGVAAGLAFTVRAGGRAVGLVEVFSTDASREFTSADLRLARALADQVGVAIENARLFQAERDQRELAEALREVGAVLNATLDFDTLLDCLLDQVKRVAPCDAANVMVVKNQQVRLARLHGYEQFGLSPASLKTVSFDLATTANLRHMAETGQPLIVADTSLEPGWIGTEATPRLHSWAGAPIILPEGAVAFFSLEKVEPNFYQPDHAERLRAFASQAALALQNARLFAAQQQRAVELEAVRQTSLSLTSSLELPVVLEAILKGAFQLTRDARDAYIFLYHADGGERLTFGAMLWHDDRTQHIWAEPRPEGMTYTVARTGEMIVVPDSRGHPLFANSPADWGEAMLGLPLKIGRRVVGVMNIAYLHVREFPESELRALRLLADQAAIAIENARLFEESQRKTQELTGLYNTALAIGSVLDTEVLLQRLHEQVQQLLNPDTFAVILNHPAAHELEIALAVEYGQPLPPAHIPVTRGGFSSWVLTTRQPLLVGDVQVNPLPVETQYLTRPARSWLGVPLIARDRVLGVVSVQSSRLHAFGEADRRFLESIASQFAIALENAQLYAETQRRLVEQTLLYECTQDLLFTQDANEALARLSERIVRHLNATAIFYYVYDGDSHMARLDYQYARPEAAALDGRGLRLPLGGEWPVSDYEHTAQALQTRSPRVLHPGDFTLSPAERENLDQRSGQTVLIIPVALHDRAIGYFEVWDTRTERNYDQEDLRLLMTLATQSAAALENARLNAEVRTKATDLGRLYAAAQDMSASLELNVVLELLAKHLTEALDATSGYVQEVNWEEETLTILAEYWSEAASETERVSDLGRVYYLNDFPTISQTLTGGDVISFNVDSPGLTEPERAQLVEYGVKSALVVPVSFRERVLGEVEIWESRRIRNFTLAEHQLAQTLVRQAAGVIENAQLFKALTDEKRRLELLYNLSQSLATSLDPREVAMKAIDQICAAFAATKGAVFVTRPGSQRLQLLAVTGADPIQVEIFDHQIRLEVGRGLAGWAAAQRKAAIAVDVTRDPHWLPVPGFDDWVRSSISIPLIAGDDLMGVFTLHSNRRSAFHADQVPLLTAATTSVAAALQNARLYAAETRRARDLALLNEITRTAVETIDLREMLQKLADRMGELLNADACYVTLWDERRQIPIPIAAFGPQRESYPALRPEPGEVTLTASALRLGHPIVVDDVFNSPYLSRRAAELSMAYSMLGLPLVTGEQKLGAVIVAFHQPHHFSPDEIARAEQAAGQIALGIERSRLFTETAEALTREQRLNEVSRTISGALDMQITIQSVVRLAGELVSADAGSLAVIASDGESLLPYYFNAPANLVSAPPMPKGAGLAWQIIETERSVLLDDYGSHPNALPEWVQAGAQGFLGVPIVAGEVCLGVLGLFRLKPDRRFNERDRALIESVGRQAGVVIQNARLFEATRRNAEEVTSASEILRALNATTDVAQAFPAVVAGVKAITVCDQVSLALIDESREYLTIVALEPYTEISWGVRVRLSETSTTPDILAGQPHLTPDLAAERDLPLERRLYEAGYRSRLNLPLRVGEQVIGILNLVWARLNGYDLARLPLLSQIADAVALAVEKNRLFAETHRRAYELEILAEVSTALRVAESTSAIMQIMLARSLAIFHAGVGAVAVPTSEPGALTMALEQGAPVPLSSQIYRLEDSIFGHVFSTGQPYLAPNLMTNPYTHADLKEWAEAQANPPSIPAMFAPLRAGQEIIGVLFVGDVTPRLFTEVDLRLLNAIAEIAGSALHRAGVLETLEQRVVERTRELAEANERLKELDRLRDQFVSNVSHELRTPLTNIKLHLGLLERRGPEVMDRYVPILQRETERLRRLIEDLLDISRLRAQISPLKREPLRLDSLLADIVAIHATRAEAKGVSLKHDLNPDVPEVAADRAQIIQVFTNLISNAVAYTAAGGRATVASYLDVHGGIHGVVIRFNNSGPVIPPEDLQHLFERFYRGQTGFASGEPGTGLGLSICKDIVERHDGHIQVQSREGEGTTFTMWLPLKA